MKVLIMAAGVGSRISRHLQGQPKCCVDINGTPLIKTTFELLHKKGLKDIAIVTGYASSYIDDALKDFTYTNYSNPFYKATNSIASVWFAKDFIDEIQDLIILNGDLFLDEGILDVLLNEKLSPVMLSDSTRIEDADYRFNWRGNKLLKYGKELSNEETTGEYVGIGKLAIKDVKIFKQRVEQFIEDGDYNCWWEDVIYRLIDNNEDIYIKDVAGIFWAEVDYIEDYKRIMEWTKSKK